MAIPQRNRHFYNARDENRIPMLSGLRVAQLRSVVPLPVNVKKKVRIKHLRTFLFICPGRESNSYSTKCRGILSPLCLPIPPPGQQCQIVWINRDLFSGPLNREGHRKIPDSDFNKSLKMGYVSGKCKKKPPEQKLPAPGVW
jgi:hypothetical protein